MQKVSPEGKREWPLRERVLIPLDADPDFKDRLEQALLAACSEFVRFGIDDPLMKVLGQVITPLKGRDDTQRSMFYLKFASLVLSHLDGRRYPQHLYDLFTQAVFSANK